VSSPVVGLRDGEWRTVVYGDAEPQPIPLATGESIIIETPDGRIVTIWCHHCDACTSLDIHSTRGNEVEEISANTGGKNHAPMGLMPWRNGSRPKVVAEPMEGSHKWPAVSAVTVVWHDEKLV